MTERNKELRETALALIKWEMGRRDMVFEEYSEERINEAVDALLDALKKARGTLN